MDGYLENKNRTTCTPKDQHTITQAVLNMLVTDMRPICMVEGDGFKALMKTLYPGYVLPSRWVYCFCNVYYYVVFEICFECKSAFTALHIKYDLLIFLRTHFTDLMEKKYEEGFQKVKAAINKNSSKIALTADAWTSVATEAYLGITCHYMGDNWEMESVALTTLPLQVKVTHSLIHPLPAL